MQIPNPAPVAKGLAVAATCMVGIPVVTRGIEAHPVLGFVALLVLVRMSASRASQPVENAGEPRPRRYIYRFERRDTAPSRPAD